MKSIYSDRGKLRKYLIIYGVVGVLLAGSLSANIVTYNYNFNLADTYRKLQTVKYNMAKMKDLPGTIDKALSDIKLVFPPGQNILTPETQIFTAIDALKLKFAGNEVSFTAMESKDNNISMPVLIKGEFDDYSAFVDSVGYLQSLKFPFFSVEGISLSQAQAFGPVRFEVKGKLKTLKN